MANEALIRALQECRARHTDNEREEKNRLRIALSLQPEIGKLIDDRREDILRGLRLAIEGIHPGNIEERTKARNLQIRDLLKKANLPEDYLSPIFQCSECHDSGYVGQFQKKLCQCVVKRYYALLTGNPSQSEKPCFQNFDLTIFPDTPLENSDVSQRQLMQVFKQRCQEYAHNISINKGPLNLLLYGPTGLGKSYLLHCIAKEITDNSILALTFSANSLLNGIRQSYFNSLQDHEKQPYYDVPVLLIDDLGTEPMWEGITIEQLIVLLDYRINNKKYTVFSTNLTPQKILKKYSERIYSRLMDKKNTLALQFQGKDLRRLSRE